MLWLIFDHLDFVKVNSLHAKQIQHVYSINLLLIIGQILKGILDVFYFPDRCGCWRMLNVIRNRERSDLEHILSSNGNDKIDSVIDLDQLIIRPEKIFLRQRERILPKN